MNLEEFRRDCENRNNNDEKVKAIIMHALRENKITEEKRDDLIAILKELRPNVHVAVIKSKSRHETQCPYPKATR